MTIQVITSFYLLFVSYRPTRMSASTDADVCTDRRGCLHRPTRMSAPIDANYIHATFTSVHQALCLP